MTASLTRSPYPILTSCLYTRGGGGDDGDVEGDDGDDDDVEGSDGDDDDVEGSDGDDDGSNFRCSRRDVR